MSNVPESEWTTVYTERVPLVRWWRTTASWWQQDHSSGSLADSAQYDFAGDGA